MKNLIAVYQKFKHMDKLLSDRHMMNYKAENKISACCHELWIAIKAAGVPDMPADQAVTNGGTNKIMKCPFRGMAICNEIRNDVAVYTDICSYCSPITGEIDKV